MCAAAWIRRLALGLAICLLAAVLAGEALAAGWGNNDQNTWDAEDMERVRKRRQERLRQQVETYKDALKVVQKEESQVGTALKQGEAKANAGSDPVQKSRTLRLARHKAIAGLKQVDFKYGRLYVAVEKLGAERDIPSEAKSGAAILLTQVRDGARTNRERMADLYEQVDEPVKALKLLESVYKGIPDTGRASAGTLKQRIKALKQQLGIRDPSDGGM